jgi:preprotein translocase subunit SecB
MSKSTSSDTPQEQPLQAQVNISAQYMKDSSFEVPNAPACFTQVKNPPKIDVGLDVRVRKVNETEFEVGLKINAKALNETETLFVVELEFCGLFSITNCPTEEHQEQILLIYCPNLLFPFARRIIADMTRDGGFQPLMINPIDFGALYLQQKNRATAETKH